jgi:phospholipid transport system substrate-binding protein
MTARMFGHLAMVALVSAFVWMTAPVALADQQAEAFTQRVIDEGITILRDNKNTGNHSKFHDFIMQYADAKPAALFTLGPYRRGANPADLDAFTLAYREFQFALYARSLAKYSDKTLKVTGSQDNKPGDVTVNTIVQGNDGNRSGNALRVSFRLLGSGGNYKFSDVQVEGAWISQSQLEQFRAILSRNGGNIPDLTQEIEHQTTRINAP